MLLLLFNHAVLRALWKIDVYLISTLVNKKVFTYAFQNSTSIQHFKSHYVQWTHPLLFIE